MILRPIPQAALDLIKSFESFQPQAYRCPAGVWTIGYGHTAGVKQGDTCTPAQAEAWLIEDCSIAAEAVSRYVTVDLNDNEYGALVSFVFNVGVGNFMHSTLLKNLNLGWYDVVPTQLSRWNRVGGEVCGGLARRRAAEGKLWNESPAQKIKEG